MTTYCEVVGRLLSDNSLSDVLPHNHIQHAISVLIASQLGLHPTVTLPKSFLLRCCALSGRKKRDEKTTFLVPFSFSSQVSH